MSELSEKQKTEVTRAALYAELKDAKTSEIANGEKMAEKKEDELATTANQLAEAKEDIQQEMASLDETQKFLVNLKATCATADKNFAQRTQDRQLEIQAVGETIGILTADDAKDTFSGTYSFVQVASHNEKHVRSKAAAALRKVGAKIHD